MEDCPIDNLLNSINLYEEPFEQKSIEVILRYCLSVFLFKSDNQLIT